MTQKTTAILFLLFFSLISQGAQADSLHRIRTGASELDQILNEMARRGNSRSLEKQVLDDISNAVDLSVKQIKSLEKDGLNYGEIYYVGLLRQQTGQSLERILALKEKGLGWGDVARRFGINPNSLNKSNITNEKQGPRSMAAIILDAIHEDLQIAYLPGSASSKVIKKKNRGRSRRSWES